MREVHAYTDHKNPRGLYEKELGSGVWWIRYADGTGRIHREKIGSFNRAKNAYTMRRRTFSTIRSSLIPCALSLSPFARLPQTPSLTQRLTSAAMATMLSAWSAFSLGFVSGPQRQSRPIT